MCMLFRKSSEINVNTDMYNYSNISYTNMYVSNCYSVMIIGIRIIHMTLNQIYSFKITCTSVVENTVPQIHVFGDWFSYTRGSECISNSTVEINSETLIYIACITSLKNVWWIIKFITHTVSGKTD